MVMFVLALAFFSLSGLQHSRLPDLGDRELALPLVIEVPVTYLGTGTYRDDPERLEIVDRLEVSHAALRGVAGEFSALRHLDTFSDDPPVPSGSPIRYLERSVPELLDARGWRFTRRSTSTDTFTKRRQIPLDAHVLSSETGQSIALPALDVSTPIEPQIEMRWSPKSQLTLLAPSGTFAATYPEGIRQVRPVSEKEELAIPVGEGRSVEISVRSAPLRDGWLATAIGGVESVIWYLMATLFGLVIAALSKPFLSRIENWSEGRFKWWRRRGAPEN